MENNEFENPNMYTVFDMVKSGIMDRDEFFKWIDYIEDKAYNAGVYNETGII